MDPGAEYRHTPQATIILQPVRIVTRAITVDIW